jgi:hypothetical protein
MRHAVALVLVSAACGSSHTHLLQTYPVSPEAVRKACAMEVSCLSPAPITSGGSCVAQFEEGMATGLGIFFGPSSADVARYVNCASSASDCTSALNCASQNHGPTWCAAHPRASCDGDTVVNCVAGWGLELADCSQFGEHCRVAANGSATCSDGSSCDPTVGAQCMGNRYVTCQGGLSSSIDCGSVIPGGTCRAIVNMSSSETGCFGPGSAACPATTTEMDSCDGATVVACSYGTQLRVDCAQFQSHCLIGSSGKYSCAADATDCTQDSHDACVGNAIQMCVNGKWETTACGSFGLGSCQTTAMGVKCS